MNYNMKYVDIVWSDVEQTIVVTSVTLIGKKYLSSPNYDAGYF